MQYIHLTHTRAHLPLRGHAGSGRTIKVCGENFWAADRIDDALLSCRFGGNANQSLALQGRYISSSVVECPMPGDALVQAKGLTGLEVQRLTLTGVPDVREVQTIEVGLSIHLWTFLAGCCH